MLLCHHHYPPLPCSRILLPFSPWHVKMKRRRRWSGCFGFRTYPSKMNMCTLPAPFPQNYSLPPTLPLSTFAAADYALNSDWRRALGMERNGQPAMQFSHFCFDYQTPFKLYPTSRELIPWFFSQNLYMRRNCIKLWDFSKVSRTLLNFFFFFFLCNL
jgi:hypothetical protein